MSTTRHLLNRHRRRTASGAETAPPPAPGPAPAPAGRRDGAAPETGIPDPAGAGRDAPAAPDPSAGPVVHHGGTARDAAAPDSVPRGAVAPAPADPETETPYPAGPETAGRSRRRGLLGRGAGGSRGVAVLGALTVLLGGFAAYAGSRADAVRAEPATRNTALVDVGRTSELKGRITRAVESVFSYDFTDPERLDRAVREHLTGRAVARHRELLDTVRAEGPRQKLVLTTTVTHSGVERVDGDRARVLVFADQNSTSATAGKGRSRTASAAAMLALDAVRGDGGWRISGIDTFGGNA